MPAAHEPLDRVDGSPGVRHRLPLGRISHEHISLVGEGDDAGCQAIAFEVGDDLRLTPSMIATTELVVPRSIPTIVSPRAAMRDLLLDSKGFRDAASQSGGPSSTHRLRAGHRVASSATQPSGSNGCANWAILWLHPRTGWFQCGFSNGFQGIPPAAGSTGCQNGGIPVEGWRAGRLPKSAGRADGGEIEGLKALFRQGFANSSTTRRQLLDTCSECH